MPFWYGLAGFLLLIIFGLIFKVRQLSHQLDSVRFSTQTDDELRKEQARLATIPAVLPGVVYQYRVKSDESNEFLFVSNGARELWEIDPAAVYQNPRLVFDLIHQEDAARVADGRRICLKSGRTWLDEFRICTPSGITKWCRGQSTPVREPDGTTTWHGVDFDITHRKQAERALQENEELLRQMVDSIPEVFWVVDWNTCKALYVSPAYQKIWGCDAQPLYADARRWAINIHPEDREAQQYRIIRPDGGERWIREVTTPIRNDQGETIRVAGLAMDVTAHKEREAELQASIQAAERANRTKTEFLARVSHEIRTPMNGILGNAELLLGEDLPARQRDRLQVLKNSAEGVLVIMNELLDLTRIESGKLALDPQPFDLHQELVKVIRIFADRAHQKGLEIYCAIAPDVPSRVIGDAGRIRQVLVNLINNAVKFTPKGSITVHVMKKRTGPGITFEVVDTGIGIQAEKLHTIFDPFSQADTSMARRYGGAGLGLTIVANLLELMGGAIEVESKPDIGSTFRFHLPLEPTDQGTASAPALDDNFVLVVAAPEVREKLIQMLSAWNMKITTVNSTEAALHTLGLAAHDYNSVVVEVDGLGPEGLKLPQQLQNDFKFAGRIVLIGKRNSYFGLQPVGNSQNVTILRKPFTSVELQAAIQGTLPQGDADIEPESPMLLPAKPIEPFHVLVAEDNEVNQMVVVEMLQRAGHSVRVVGNGVEALAALAEESFDLVLMDIQMPELDGWEATTRIRQSEREQGKHVPIIGLTAMARKSDEEKCIQVGMDGYVCKPVTWHNLLGVITAATEKPAYPASLATPEPASLVDRSGILLRLGNHIELARQLLTVFDKVYPRLLNEIRSAIRQQDAKQLETAAHKLAGNLAVFEQGATLQATRDLEQLGQTGELSNASKVLDRLEGYLSQLLTELHDWLLGQ